jgi:hypothetical protein
MTRPMGPYYVTVIRHPLVFAGAAGLVVALAGCAARPARDLTDGQDPQVAEDISRLQAATRAFHTLDSAVTAGYPREVKDCLVHEHHGAMGYHHVNRGYLDDRVDVERPEILLYEKLPNGDYRLNGVEFIVPYRAWPRDSVAPALMGQQLKPEDKLNIWYLHVWAWTKNPDGLFADFNPAVNCPDSTRKVYTPFSDPLR